MLQTSNVKHIFFEIDMFLCIITISCVGAIDRILADEDDNKDGYIDYMEFAYSLKVKGTLKQGVTND